MNYQSLIKQAAALLGAFAITTGLLLAQQKTEQAAQQAGAYPMDRTVLPIAEPNYPHSTVLDARDAKPPPRFEVKAPAGAPNVLIVLIDDMGFGMPSAFGGPIHMPTVERLPPTGCATTSSTRRRSARRRARRCSPAATTT